MAKVGLREGIAECIRGAVVALTETTDDGVGRRAKQEEIQVAALQRRVQDQCPARLRLQYRFGSSGSFEMDDAATGDTRRVNDAVNVSKLLTRELNDVRHRLFVRDVRRECEHLATQLFQSLDLPTLAFGYDRTPGQYQTGLYSACNLFGQDEPDAAEPAGEQVNTALTQAWREL